MAGLAFRLFLFVFAAAVVVTVIAIADAVAGGPWAAPFAVVAVGLIVVYDITAFRAGKP